MASLVHRPRRGGEARLVVIRHHRVYPDTARPLYRLGVSERVLDAQLAWLARRGFTPVTVADGLARLDAGSAGVTVAMSFDDGYADNLERALPLLERHGARATFFLTAGLIETRTAPWWDRLAWMVARANLPRSAGGGSAPALRTEADRPRALAALLPSFRLPPAEQARRLDALQESLEVRDATPCELATWDDLAVLKERAMEVGAHTLGHPFLDLMAADDQRREIAGSVALIEARLGVRPAGVAFPGGGYDDASIDAARAAGLAYAVTTRAGDNRRVTPRFELRRRGLSEGACLAPGGAFSPSLALAELDGAFDRARGVEARP
jgi:peptidoglycan/xylan/chitin deacetylase (PgdA/CDA1 family)